MNRTERVNQLNELKNHCADMARFNHGDTGSAWEKDVEALGEVIEETENPKGVSAVIDEVKDAICTSYCKHPEKWDAEAEGMELFESDICQNCPLNRL